MTIEGKYINQDLAGSNFIFGPGTSVGMLEAGSYKLNLTITYRETARQEKWVLLRDDLSSGAGFHFGQPRLPLFIY